MLSRYISNTFAIDTKIHRALFLRNKVSTTLQDLEIAFLKVHVGDFKF